MNFKEAHEQRKRYIEATGNLATVPNGHGHDGYFVQIWRSEMHQPVQPIRLMTATDVQADIKQVLIRREELARRLEQESRPRFDTRSPLDRMIDQATGYRP